MPLRIEDAPAEVYLKLENLQPTGSFKVRGAGNAIEVLSPARRAGGVWTCSAGNMAQALAYHARRVGVPCTAIVPEGAPRTKLEGLARLQADVIRLPGERVWAIADAGAYEPLAAAAFVHPFNDPGVIAGNGTIGLEVHEDLPDVDAVVVPFGGGGLAVGIAAAVKAVRPAAKVLAVEPDTGAAFAASLRAGRPVNVPYAASFVDAIGDSRVAPEMWPLARALLDGGIEVSLRETADAVRLLAERARIVAEGAAGAAVAAALAGRAGTGRVVAIVSGGNIDLATLSTILHGDVP